MPSTETTPQSDMGIPISVTGYRDRRYGLAIGDEVDSSCWSVKMSSDKTTIDVAATRLLRRLNTIQERKLRQERTDKDYAIEHGRYLANAAEQFMLEQNRAAEEEREPSSEFWSALETAIYEFRKRASRADGKPVP